MNFDKLAVTGAATLSGFLGVNVVGGFMPTAGQTFSVLSASSLIANVGVSGPDAAWFTAAISRPELLLRFVIADFDSNGMVNAADLVKWRQGSGIAGGASQSQGDANADGRVDAGDFLVWQLTAGHDDGVDHCGRSPRAACGVATGSGGNLAGNPTPHASGSGPSAIRNVVATGEGHDVLLMAPTHLRAASDCQPGCRHSQ